MEFVEENLIFDTEKSEVLLDFRKLLHRSEVEEAVMKNPEKYKGKDKAVYKIIVLYKTKNGRYFALEYTPVIILDKKDETPSVDEIMIGNSTSHVFKDDKKCISYMMHNDIPLEKIKKIFELKEA